MSYGIQFLGDDSTPVIATYGDNFRFIGKYTTPDLTQRGSGTNHGDAYIITTPPNIIPVIFVRSPIGQFRAMKGPHRVNSTTWYVGVISGNQTAPNCELYVFAPRRGVQTEEGWGVSTFDSNGDLVYTSDSSHKSLSVSVHRPEIFYFDEVTFNNSVTYTPDVNGGTFTTLGVTKPAWYMPSPYTGYLANTTYYHLFIRINSDGTFSLAKLRDSTTSGGGSTRQIGLNVIGIPFIDGARYD